MRRFFLICVIVLFGGSICIAIRMKITKHPVLPEETISSYTIRFTLPRKDDSSEYFYRTVVLDKTASIDSLTESLRDAKKADLRYIGNYTAVQIIGTYRRKTPLLRLLYASCRHSIFSSDGMQFKIFSTQYGRVQQRDLACIFETVFACIFA